MDDTDRRFPIAFTGPEMKDLRLSVKCKPVSGKVDQGCGLVFRLKDADNYYVVRGVEWQGRQRRLARSRGRGER